MSLSQRIHRAERSFHKVWTRDLKKLIDDLLDVIRVEFSREEIRIISALWGSIPTGIGDKQDISTTLLQTVWDRLDDSLQERFMKLEDYSIRYYGEHFDWIEKMGGPTINLEKNEEK